LSTRHPSAVWKCTRPTATQRNGEIWLATPAGVAIHTRDGRAERCQCLSKTVRPIRIDTDLIISQWPALKPTVALRRKRPRFLLIMLNGCETDSAPRSQHRHQHREPANRCFRIRASSPSEKKNPPGSATWPILTATCPELGAAGLASVCRLCGCRFRALGDFLTQRRRVELAACRFGVSSFPISIRPDSVDPRECAMIGRRNAVCAGYDLPRETGIEGLWCVGDAGKGIWQRGGTQACAENGQDRHRCHPCSTASPLRSPAGF